MVRFDIDPTVSVDEIKFGSSRSDVRNRYGECEEFKKNKYSKNTTDDFGDFHVYYTEDDEFEAIEFFPDDSYSIFINGKKLTNNISELKEMFPDLVEDSDSYTSVKCSVGFDYDDGCIESILFGCQDYYK